MDALARRTAGGGRVALLDLTRWGEAIDAFHHALARNPRYTAAHRDLGRALLEAGEVAEAARVLRSALELARETGDLQTGREMELLRSKEPETEVKPPPKRRKAKWFERHRWFISSDDMLVIGGRDANGNAEIVEKHMEPGDLYLHAEIVGAPHVVIKSAGKEMVAFFGISVPKPWEFGQSHRTPA